MKTISKPRTQKQYEKQQDRLMLAHIKEAGKRHVSFYNLGWASGEDFIHSKTSKGRLFTQLNKDGSYSHKWQTQI